MDGEFRYKSNPTRWLRIESQGNRYDYKVYIILNTNLHLVQAVSDINISQNIAH